MLNRSIIAGALLAVLAALPSSASAQGLTDEKVKDLILDAVSIEVAEDICSNVDIAGEELVEIGEAKHFLRGKAGLTKVELAAVRGAMEAEAKKDKAAYCLGVRSTYRATYKKLLSAAD